MEAAVNLSEIPLESLPKAYVNAFNNGLEDYISAMEYAEDFPYSGYNLGNLYVNLGELRSAEQAYLDAIRIDRESYRTMVNLAMLYNGTGKKEEAEQLLEEIVKKNPQWY